MSFILTNVSGSSQGPFGFNTQVTLTSLATYTVTDELLADFIVEPVTVKGVSEGLISVTVGSVVMTGNSAIDYLTSLNSATLPNNSSSLINQSITGNAILAINSSNCSSVAVEVTGTISAGVLQFECSLTGNTDDWTPITLFDTISFFGAVSVNTDAFLPDLWQGSIAGIPFFRVRAAGVSGSLFVSIIAAQSATGIANSFVTNATPALLQDGSGNNITSQANGSQRALDVGINVAGVQIDPRNQGTPGSLANAWPVEVTDGTNVLGTSSHPVRIDPTGTTIQPVSGTVTANAGTGNFNVIQATASNLNATIIPQSITKGTQGSTGITVQNLKDAGRTYVTMVADRVTGVTSETLVTVTINKAGTTSSSNSYTVTTGKTFRIQSIAATVENSSTAAATSRIRVRSTSSSIATTSPIVANIDLHAGGTTAGLGSSSHIPIPDGLEIASAQQIAISQLTSTTSSIVTVTLIGFEY